MKKFLKKFVRSLFWPWRRVSKFFETASGCDFVVCCIIAFIGILCGLCYYAIYDEHGLLISVIYGGIGLVCMLLLHLLNRKWVAEDDQWIWLLVLMVAYLLWPFFVLAALLGAVCVAIAALYCWAYEDEEDDDEGE